MQRRDFLKLTAATGGLAGLAIPGPVFSTGKPRSGSLVLTDVNADTPAAHLEQVITTILSHAVPLACVVDTGSRSGQPLGPGHAVSQILRAAVSGQTGLFEIVAFVPGLSRLSPYFQARAAFKARRNLIRALGFTAKAPAPASALQSIASPVGAAPLAPDGLRAAGFRSVLVIPTQTQSATSETWENGQVRFFGGSVSDIGTAAAALDQRDRNQAFDLHYLSANGFGSISAQQAAMAASAIAREALGLELAGRVSNLKLSDLVLRDDFKFNRLVGLHLFTPPATLPALADGVARFRAELERLNFAFSTGRQPSPDPLTRCTGFWVGAATDHSGNDAPEFAVCTPTAPEPGFRVHLNDPVGGEQGVDGDAHLHLPTLSLQDLIDQHPRATPQQLSTSELVLTIPPEILQTQPARMLARKHLIDFSRAGVAEYVPVSRLAQARYPRSALISRFQQVTSARDATRHARQSTASAQRAQLVEDAKLAWSYFERTVHPSTGLCPSTVSGASGGGRLNFITMWEIASHFNALMAARALEFIDQAGFRARSTRVLSRIKGRSSDGRLLPQEWLKTGASYSGDGDFDACDSGRLLASLRNLADHPDNQADVAGLVESWDLDKVIVEGRLQSIKAREMQEVYLSHCTNYAARAFRSWGLTVQSPYDVMQGKDRADGQMALLHAAQKIGVIGTEPLLLEALDFDLSPETGFLAETLFAAQLRNYQNTGVLTCVSETPINREPWFTYQGLNLGNMTDEWVVEPDTDKDEYRSAEFRNEYFAISPKAAYLWATLHPHDYSDRLVEFVQENCRTNFGFSSAYFVNQNKAATHYTDLNTNGIILQALAARLA